MIKKILSEAIKNDSLPQTVLFLGEGAKLSKELSEMILDDNPDNSPDFFSYEFEDYTADSLREFLREAQKTGKRVFLFNSFDEMDGRLQNFLLKIFEEPSLGKTFFLVASNREKILPTILSRATIIKIKKMPKNEKKALLIERGFSKEDAEDLSFLSENEFDETFLDDRKRLLKKFSRYLEGSRTSLSEIADFFEEKKGYENIFIDCLIIFLRKKNNFQMIWKLEEAKNHIERYVAVRNAILKALYI